MACSGGVSSEGQAASPAMDKSTMEVVLNIQKKVKPEFVSAFRASFEKCKVSTVKEPGCISYGMYQSYSDSTLFFIEEVWKNDGELAKHGQTDHLKLHLSEIKDMNDPGFNGFRRKIFVCPEANK
ncbi:MAG TPA: antibiotic biosynthesis monooxygenase [Candidatus Parabacteroides intestinipullorum]|uniref:Antibiotic biosynthesis monooxygenase n=1 Tax=Candidatus Parabacteroides intestinipullorum TaxID=2838723 RepID=A0A9D1X7N4_9BACT|nr:antibiotic biosynthesis monooxygenase [Candidatus Parabacteroides intestinipullorum]